MPRATPAAPWRACCPSLTPAGDVEVTLIDDGWDFQVARAGDLVVRVPRRDDLVPSARIEARVLTELAPLLPVQVPEPRQLCEAHGTIVYRWLEGRALDHDVVDRVGEQVLAGHLADLVARVHDFPPERAAALGVGRTDLRGQVAQFEATVLPVLSDQSRARRLLDQARELLDGSQPRFVHGDLGPAHLLCDSDGLVAVLDWTAAALGDPAQDLAWILNGLGRRLRAPFLAAAPSDPDVLERADLIHRLGPWWEVLYGLEHDLPAFVDSGRAGVEQRLPR